MLSLIVPIQSTLLLWGAALARGRRRREGRREEGQATAEYALVLLGAAAVALLVVAWASDTNRISKLLDAVVDQLLSHVS